MTDSRRRPSPLAAVVSLTASGAHHAGRAQTEGLERLDRPAGVASGREPARCCDDSLQTLLNRTSRNGAHPFRNAHSPPKNRPPIKLYRYVRLDRVQSGQAKFPKVPL